MMGKCMFLRKGETHTKPTAGILASDLAVGTVVKLMEGGVAADYLVVNQGIPNNSNLYHSTGNGTWLLRKNIYTKRAFDSPLSTNVNNYSKSAINTWLNGDFFNSLGSVEQRTIMQVKVPYWPESYNAGEGVSCKVFLLGAYELGFTSSNNSYIPQDGAKLSYFDSGTGSTANNKRVAQDNSGASTTWWTRSSYTNDDYLAWYIATAGSTTTASVDTSQGIRPALILPSNARFDETTMILKGVA